MGIAARWHGLTCRKLWVSLAGAAANHIREMRSFLKDALAMFDLGKVPCWRCRHGSPCSRPVQPRSPGWTAVGSEQTQNPRTAGVGGGDQEILQSNLAPFSRPHLSDIDQR